MARRLFRILVVEDDAEMRALIAEALEDIGETLEAGDFDEGVRLLLAPDRPRLDLLIVDCMLPSGCRRQLAGIELVRLVAARWPLLPVVVITGADLGESIVIESFRSGARDFLRKPFDIADLLAAVERVTRRRVAREALARSGSEDAVQEAAAFIREHYAEPLSLASLSAMAAMSRWHFCRLFRGVTGQALRDYLRDVRLDRARELLLTSRLSLTEIAHEVGFYDLPHFDKAFRRRFRLSPTEFLRSNAAARTDACSPAARA